MRTRRQALIAVAAVAVARPAAALASDPDRGTLTALVAFQQQVVFGYEVALRRGPFGDRDRGTLEGFRRDAAAASAALAGALRQTGGKPPASPDPASAPAAADPSRRGYLRDLITAEEDAVARYYTGLAELTGHRHLSGSAAFMAQAGRRLVVLRRLAGDPLLPRTFETGAA